MGLLLFIIKINFWVSLACFLWCIALWKATGLKIEKKAILESEWFLPTLLLLLGCVCSGMTILVWSKAPTLGGSPSNDEKTHH
jgi:hypothetical protein